MAKKEAFRKTSDEETETHEMIKWLRQNGFPSLSKALKTLSQKRLKLPHKRK